MGTRKLANTTNIKNLLFSLLPHVCLSRGEDIETIPRAPSVGKSIETIGERGNESKEHEPRDDDDDGHLRASSRLYIEREEQCGRPRTVSIDLTRNPAGHTAARRRPRGA